MAPRASKRKKESRENEFESASIAQQGHGYLLGRLEICYLQYAPWKRPRLTPQSTYVG
jgi:hypothetical protein